VNLKGRIEIITGSGGVGAVPLDTAPCQGRVGSPLDIANVAAFLVSDEAGWITGVNMTVDWGMTKKMMYPVEDVTSDAIEILTGDGELSNIILELISLPSSKLELVEFFINFMDVFSGNSQFYKLALSQLPR